MNRENIHRDLHFQNAMHCLCPVYMITILIAGLFGSSPEKTSNPALSNALQDLTLNLLFNEGVVFGNDEPKMLRRAVSFGKYFPHFCAWFLNPIIGWFMMFGLLMFASTLLIFLCALIIAAVRFISNIFSLILFDHFQNHIKINRFQLYCIAFYYGFYAQEVSLLVPIPPKINYILDEIPQNQVYYYARLAYGKPVDYDKWLKNINPELYEALGPIDRILATGNKPFPTILKSNSVVSFYRAVIEKECYETFKRRRELLLLCSDSS